MGSAEPTPDAALLLRPKNVARTSLKELAALPVAGGSQGLGADGEVVVQGISSTSELVRPGDLFAAMPGAHGHGAQYIERARSAGAVAVLTDPAGEVAARSAGLATLIVTHPRAVLAQISARIYGNPSRDLAIVGVTGTSGKTTTTALIRAGLDAAGISSGLIGTLGVFAGRQAIKTGFTTPEAPELQALLAVLRERQVGVVAMEVSSHALSLGRVDGIEFAVGAFTNLSHDHLDFHADMEDYFRAKAKLFDGRARREIVVTDSEWGRRLVTPATITVSTEPVGTDSAAGRATWQAEQISTRADGGTDFTVRDPQGITLRTGCAIPGHYNVANSVLALAVLAEIGIDVSRVAPAMAAAQVPGRMQRIAGAQPFLVVVDYSHKPAGVAAALAALRPLAGRRLAIVLGCGGDRDRGKRPVMGRVAAQGSDLLIVTDDNPRGEDPASIRREMLAGALDVAPRGRVLEEGDRRAAIQQALAWAQPGDTVLIAGKGHETGQQVGDVMLPFDDVAVASETLIARGYAGGLA